MKIKHFIQIIIGLLFILWSCKDDKTFQGNHDPDVIKTYHNNSTPFSKMDSLSSVNFITKQKLTELYELASLYSSNQNDSLMLDILFPQIQSYFLGNDTITISKLMREIDSLQVYYVEINSMEFAEKDTLTPDSMRMVNYNVLYYNKNKKLIENLPKTAQYILKKEPKKFKNEFIFYFTGLEPFQEVKDTMDLGVTQ